RLAPVISTFAMLFSCRHGQSVSVLQRPPYYPVLVNNLTASAAIGEYSCGNTKTSEDNDINLCTAIKKPCRSRVLSVIVRIRQKPAERSVISDVCAASSRNIPALYNGYAVPHFPTFPADYAALP